MRKAVCYAVAAFLLLSALAYSCIGNAVQCGVCAFGAACWFCLGVMS